MAPVFLQYQGEGEFKPSNKRQANECDKRFVVGEIYPLDVDYGRSTVSHNHEFAFVKTAWDNLPEHYSAALFAQSPTHLRRYALIMTGWCDTSTQVCASNAEAMRTAAFIRPMDEYSVVVVNGVTVNRMVAKSQSRKAMGGKVFQQSKQAVMDYLEDLIGVPKGSLEGKVESCP